MSSYALHTWDLCRFLSNADPWGILKRGRLQDKIRIVAAGMAKTLDSFGKWWGVPERGVPPKKCFIVGNPFKMEDLGYLHLWKPPYLNHRTIFVDSPNSYVNWRVWLKMTSEIRMVWYHDCFWPLGVTPLGSFRCWDCFLVPSHPLGISGRRWTSFQTGLARKQISEGAGALGMIINPVRGWDFFYYTFTFCLQIVSEPMQIMPSWYSYPA